MHNKTIYVIKSIRVEANLFCRIIVIVLLLSGPGLQSQESINTAGGFISGSGGSVSYTIGQVVYQTHIGINGSVAEGVQQPYEISVVTGINETMDIQIAITAYPNPAVDNLTLTIRENNGSDLLYQMYDMSGKLLQSGKITSNQASIEMTNLIASTYFVKIIQGNREVKTFKIIKTQ